MTKSYVIAMRIDSAESLGLALYLQNKAGSFIHSGDYDEYMFYYLDLTDEEATFITLTFGCKLMESRGESMNDVIVRIFNEGNKPRLSS